MWYASSAEALRYKSTAAPATVSGEHLPDATDLSYRQVGKAASCTDPRARRPAILLVACRAGCLGDGRVHLDCAGIGSSRFAPVPHPEYAQ